MADPQLIHLPPPPSGKTGWPWTPTGAAYDVQPPGSAWPRISVVTPSYNQGQFLEQALRSVLLQTYPNLEYIVLDGGSGDDSAAILEKYSNYLTYWRSAEDAGQAAALKEGFRMASGEILAWINADDFYEPQVFHRLARMFAANPAVTFVNADVNLVDKQGRHLRTIPAIRPSVFFAANLGQHGWPQPGCFWRSSAYEAVGGVDAGFHFCMDLDLFTRLAQTGTSQRLSGPPVANFRQHEASKTATQQATLQREKAQIVAAYGDPFWSGKPRLMRSLWWLYSRPTAVRLRWKLLRDKTLSTN